MPTTTRSKTKQSHLEDFVDVEPARQPHNQRSESSKKRPAQPSTSSHPTKRRRAKTEDDEDSGHSDGNGSTEHGQGSEESENRVIKINRAPVLHLWAACMTARLYPAVSWETCLSAGAAVSALCAVAKGRAIGVMEKPDEDGKKKVDEKKKNKDELHVMQFHLHLKSGLALVSGKPKPSGEAALKSKFGGEEAYEVVRSVFVDALEGWKEREDELGSKGFKMYEKFRPSVKAGQAGWGRKGELRLDEVRKIVEEG